MPRRIIVILLVVALSAFTVYLAVHWSARLPGVEAKGGGGGSEAVGYAALATSVVSLATALVGLAKTLLDGREIRRRT
jgi:hypothetical protein